MHMGPETIELAQCISTNDQANSTPMETLCRMRNDVVSDCRLISHATVDKETNESTPAPAGARKGAGQSSAGSPGARKPQPMA
jgi:hypothetical protein